MPRNAAQIIRAATLQAKVPGFAGLAPGATTAIALDELNNCLGHIARTVDFSAARGQWNFTFNSNLTVAGGGNIVLSGANPLPMDYLRVGVSGGSVEQDVACAQAGLDAMK